MDRDICHWSQKVKLNLFPRSDRFNIIAIVLTHPKNPRPDWQGLWRTILSRTSVTVMVSEWFGNVTVYWYTSLPLFSYFFTLVDKKFRDILVIGHLCLRTSQEKPCVWFTPWYRRVPLPHPVRISVSPMMWTFTNVT